MPPHPDRIATTLAVRAQAAERAPQPWDPPGSGSSDARLDLKLLRHATERALAERGTDAARQRLAGLDTPDLLAGTVQDGVARGLRVAYEEALSLCQPPPPPVAPEQHPLTKVFVGAELRRRREFTVTACDGVKVRFSRRGGLHLLVRSLGIDAPGFVAFEDRTDDGTLDAFVAREGERPRLFSPAFLQPVRYHEGPTGDGLLLRGRLGRRPAGNPCELWVTGARDEPFLRLGVRIDNRHHDHRLRIRFLGIDDDRIGCDGPLQLERVARGHRAFAAATLVRANGRLQVGDELVAVPDAQCKCVLEHHFHFPLGRR